jgi:hypothetical protein
MGRPPKPPRERLSYVLGLRLTRDERRALERVARREGKPAAALAREILMRALKRREAR